MLDGTVGCAGHASGIASRLAESGRLIAVDRDPEMVGMARTRLSGCACRVDCSQSNFAELRAILKTTGVAKVDGVLLDLGVSSAQIDAPERGFSFRSAGPLSMQMTPAEGPSAADLVNTLSAAELERLFREYGEERWARRIAARIVRERKRARIRWTTELAGIIAAAAPPGPRRLHPARRCFQALRIACNRELENLERFLAEVPDCLRERGRLVILSYHSLEDRRVKTSFRELARQGVYEILNKKVVRPRPEEVAGNPRSRSARLRAVLRTAR